ncbi:hypothetical protein MKX01_020723 [Papaver californicum]|nr:hypothetical protein MKX01_020723 [Papaver californicum]
MYSKFGMMDEVEILFKELPEKNLISWTAIITGFYQQKCFEKALKQFCDMRKSGEDPNEHTFVVVMASCGGMLVPLYGRMIHAQAIKFGMFSSLFVGTAILDMYSESNQMDDARKQFEEMGNSASDVSWNELVAAYVRNGKMVEALEAFDRMLGNGILCDQFTYSNVLKQIKDIGYTPDASLVLHQGVGVSKDEQVLYHSEKLAVYFGLLNLPTGKPIRVCQDCHSAIKFSAECPSAYALVAVKRFLNF